MYKEVPRPFLVVTVGVVQARFHNNAEMQGDKKTVSDGRARQ
jgi:hypothetical protein